LNFICDILVSSFCFQIQLIVPLRNGKSVCMYDVEGRALLRKFPLSKSKAMDGTIEGLDSNRVTDAGPLDLLPGGSADEEEGDIGLRRGARGGPGGGGGAGGGGLPGAGAGGGAGANTAGDPRARPTIRCKHVTFAPTGQGWAASTTEGVMVYTRDTGLAFDPTDLGEDVTPAAARAALRAGDARRALLMALRLRGADGEGALIRDVLEGTPPDAVAGALQGFPAALLPPLLESLAQRVVGGPHAQLMLRWTRELCVAHGRAIHGAAHGGMGGALVGAGAGAGGAEQLLPALRRLSKAFAALHEDLAATAETSVFLLDYVCAAPAVNAQA
jgi:periodic tryptophan protein 2